METSVKEYSHKYFLTPGECNPEQRLPLPLLVSRLIEVATEHANTWGVGYAKLKDYNQTWVLSRVTVEMERYPRVNQEYTLTTWIEEYNRHFSQRNFSIADCNGEIIGYARTIWVVIDTEKRTSCDISKLSYISANISDMECPIEPQSRLTPVRGFKSIPYTFQYIDTDSNRHVNSVRYIELLMNNWTLDHYDHHYISRFEISYIKECVYGMNASVNINDSDNPLDCKAEIEVGGESHCRARLVFKERDYTTEVKEENKK